MEFDGSPEPTLRCDLSNESSQESSLFYFHAFFLLKISISLGKQRAEKQRAADVQCFQAVGSFVSDMFPPNVNVHLISVKGNGASYWTSAGTGFFLPLLPNYARVDQKPISTVTANKLSEWD